MLKKEVISIYKRSIYFQLKSSTKSLKVIRDRELIARCYQIS